MVYSNPGEYLYNLEASSSSEARRLWKNSIKDEWNRKCAYCDSKENLTLDHIIPQSKGGTDEKHNMLCACKYCNRSKGHTPWKDWFKSQEFFTIERMNDIINWTEQDMDIKYVVYRPRKNNT
jgi:hypothetical protein